MRMCAMERARRLRTTRDVTGWGLMCRGGGGDVQIMLMAKLDGAGADRVRFEPRALLSPPPPPPPLLILSSSLFHQSICLTH